MNRGFQSHKKVSKNKKNTQDKAILIGIEFFSNGSSPLGNNLKELNGLAETAHYNVISIISQKLHGLMQSHLLEKARSKKSPSLSDCFPQILLFLMKTSPRLKIET